MEFTIAPPAFAVVTGLVATVFAFLMLGFAHWATQRMSREDLPILMRYTAGNLLISVAFAIWCAVQPGPIPAWWALLAFLAILGGAGLGTTTSHALDAWSGREAAIAILEKQVE